MSPPKKCFTYNFFSQLFLLNQHTSFTKNFSYKKMIHKKKFSEIFFQIKTSFHYVTFFPPKNFFQLKSVLPYTAAPRPNTFAWSGLCQHGWLSLAALWTARPGCKFAVFCTWSWNPHRSMMASMKVFRAAIASACVLRPDTTHRTYILRGSTLRKRKN